MRAGTREAITLTATNEKTHLDPVTLEHSEAGLPGEDTSHPLAADAPVHNDAPTFAELGVRAEIVRALGEAGIERTFAIQELTLPLALAGDDVIGQARTGTGKTLGFGIPLLQRITVPGDGTPQALVVVPTRELCLQVTHDLTDAAKHLGVRVLAIYGGRPYEPQIAALRKGVDVVVGTPGRLLDLAEQRHLVLGKVRGLVLDEADEMLDLGFLPDIERILRMVPDERQTMLFSATMPGPIITLARTFLNQPTHVRAEENDAGAVHERTEQFVYRAHALDKTELLARALQARERGLSMIFTRTKRTAQKVADELVERGFAAAAVHGDLGQGAREQALRAFRSGKIDVLVATDVAARGIDVEGVTHVINYQCPEDEKTYVHRIGRTGRAGRTGVAVTLVDWDETPRWKMISDTLDLGKPDPVETYSTSDHLFSDLDIPAGSTGRLPLGLRTRAGLGAEPEEDLKGERKSRGRRRGKGASPRGDAPAEGATAESGSRTPRRRRRSRGGVVDAAEATEVAGAAADVAEAPVGTTEAAVEGGAPKRTRRRKPAGAGAQAAAEPAAEQAAEAVAGPAAEGSTEPAGRTRTRRRKADATADVPAEGTTGPATAEGTAEAASGATGDEGSTGSAGRTRTRRRKAATTPEATPEVAAEVNAEVTAGAAEVAAESTPEGAQEGPAKRTRRRKPAEPPAEGAEAAERPRRRKAAEASPEAGAERPPSRKADAPDAEDSDERPRRRRRRRTGAEAEGSADALPSAD
ncbi:DEAD/DEAH box helicase [Saccharothrix algeriensis]|uniref:RNA helicase n=3 Tax=Saccharothrix algeriensis TaxID=173560 RepID=A0ABS2S549_9PSEU|nr:DEAD/DEAH box helicase [Saccharothrix algeriensis]MBM7811359.1 superfamily II DNA/RNA helicase [Saccharothrix algeriensis]